MNDLLIEDIFRMVQTVICGTFLVWSDEMVARVDYNTQKCIVIHLCYTTQHKCIQVRVAVGYVALQGYGWVAEKARTSLLAMSWLLRAGFWEGEIFPSGEAGQKAWEGKKFCKWGVRKGEKGMAERMGALPSGRVDLSSQGDSWE